MSLIEVFLLAVLLAFFAGGAVLIWKMVFAATRMEKFSERRDLFEWNFTKLLLSFKIKVLHDELKKRSTTIDELKEIEDNALGTKVSNKHVLDEIEEEVKGQVKQAGKGK